MEGLVSERLSDWAAATDDDTSGRKGDGARWSTEGQIGAAAVLASSCNVFGVVDDVVVVVVVIIAIIVVVVVVIVGVFAVLTAAAAVLIVFVVVVSSSSSPRLPWLSSPCTTQDMRVAKDQAEKALERATAASEKLKLELKVCLWVMRVCLSSLAS
jgi:hypothetical protein